MGIIQSIQITEGYPAYDAVAGALIGKFHFPEDHARRVVNCVLDTAEHERKPVAQPKQHYRDVLVAFYQDPHHRPSADSTLNELHQHGWKVVPRDG